MWCVAPWLRYFYWGHHELVQTLGKVRYAPAQTAGGAPLFFGYNRKHMFAERVGSKRWEELTVWT